MKNKGAPGLPAGEPAVPAANEEFTEEFAATRDPVDGLGDARAGWDPYEVWRTRVKSSSGTKGQRESDPR
jgi:hypothetical protein